jgi:hypothetical protein
MSWMNEIAGVLQNYSQGAQAGSAQSAPAGNTGEVANHFDQVAQAAPAPALADGLAAMFRSNQTPPFAQMVSQLFSNSNGSQRASLLNTLLASSGGAGAISQLMQSAGVNLGGSPGSAQVTPEVAAQVSPEIAQQAAAQVAEHDPSIIDRVSEIYAQHPTLVKTLGAVAMSMALSHLASRR